MPWSHDPNVQALRLKYNAARTAYEACDRALAEAHQSGVAPSAELIEKEALARERLEQAQQALFAAMAAIVSGGAAGASDSKAG